MSDLSRAQELRVERRQLAERMREILDEPAGEDGLLSAEQDTEFDRLHEEQERLHGEITDLEARDEAAREREERLAAVEADLRASRGTKAGRQDTRALDLDDEEEREDGAPELYDRAFNTYLRWGVGFMSPEERGVFQAAYRADTPTSAFTPESRVQTVAQDTKGGFLVPQGMMQSVTRALKQFGGLRRSRAQIVPTSDGREIPWPTYDDTSNEGALIAEAATRTDQDVTFGQAILHAYGYTSKFVKISFELLQDSEQDLPSMIGGIAGERIGRTTARHFTTGDGAAKPFGVVTQAPSGVTAAFATSVEWDELLDLKHSVDVAYRESAQWMFNDATLKELKKLKDGDGNPLWQSNVQTREPPSIDGDPYVVNIAMPNTAASQKAILYGDFSHYKIRDVAGMTLRRLDERFAEQGQVAFILFSRHDGVLVDAGQGPIKALTMAA